MPEWLGWEQGRAPTHFEWSETFRGKQGHWRPVCNFSLAASLLYAPGHANSPLGFPCMARVGSSTDGLNAVASLLVLGTVLCLKFMAQAAKWMLIWYFFYRKATVIHRVITS